jgi:hypothetical protein
MTRRHKSDTRTFAELTFGEQAKCINAQLATLTRAMRRHMRLARQQGRDAERTRAKCVAQVERLRQRIEQ